MSDVSPLGQLIEDVRAAFLDRNGVELSYRAIARRGGSVIGGNHVQQIAKAPRLKALPHDTTLRALAKGLDVPYSIVLEKALVSAGYSVPTRQPDEDRRIG